MLGFLSAISSLISHDWRLFSPQIAADPFPNVKVLDISLRNVFTTMAPSHLIIVCGHAVWAGGPKNGWDEAEWLIEGFQQGETPTFIEHIKAGVRLLGQDENATLVFSG